LYNDDLNLCVVGDDDQTIYQWRGSQIRNILEFADRYPNVHQVRLEENFRSSAGIIDVATRTIENNADRLPKRMQDTGAQIYEKGDILYNNLENEEAENDFIVRTIRKLRGVAFKEKGFVRGLDYSDFCILLRKWSKADSIVAALNREGIPFIVSGVNNLFQTREVRAARGIFEYLSDQIDASVLTGLWNEVRLDPTRADLEAGIKFLNGIKRRLGASEDRNKLSYDRFVLQEIYQEFLKRSQITEETILEDDITPAQESPSENGNSGTEAEEEHANARAEIVFYNLGQFSHVIGDYEQINFKSKPPLKLSFFMSFLRYAAEDYYPEGWLNSSYRTPNAVQLMTIHQAKGLEFPVVFLPGLNRNYLPSKKHSGKSVWHVLDRSLVADQERYEINVADERRLFYVALTRAQKFLFISRAPLGSRLYQRASDFHGEISHSDYLFSNADRDYSDRDRAHPTPRASTNKIFLNFSVLRDFFECPYRFKLISMYGFESPLNVRVGYGRSIHSVLMELHR
ncbi:MAG: ATP-dependent helicase, partial [Leptospiraceae bacterium]|nr:ATP-dependent helicase [Leptospiraceae bacterium]